MPHLLRIALAPLLVTASLAAASGPAHAQDGRFQVSVRVLPGPAPAAVELPVPPQSQLLSQNAHARTMLYPGNVERARRFYEDAMPAAGFRLASGQGDGSVSLWENADSRAEVLLHPVLGSADATRIVLMISAKKTAHETATAR